MRTHRLIQNTPEWHAHRAAYFNASDAPAALGASPYKTRTQLLHERFTGITPEVDAHTQRRFDEGHRVEALARPLAEDILDDDLYPVVGTLGNLSASFDGLTMDGTIVFEHKSLNDDLRSAMKPGCKGADLPLHYRIQMEQQLAVSGAKYCLFMASTWDGDVLIEERHCIYDPDMGLRAQIMAGWAQFEIDLRDYQPPKEVEVKPIGRAPELLPALHIQVTGSVLSSNIDKFKEHAMGVLAGINRTLETDEDFANAEKTIKWCAEVEERLAAAKAHALSQLESIEANFRAVDEVSGETRRVRLELTNLVKAQKELMKNLVITQAKTALADHMEALNQRLGERLMPTVAADFAGAMKNKKNIDSMRDAVSVVLANAKAEANMIGERIEGNLKTLRDVARDHGFLFSDRAGLVLKQHDDLIMLTSMRINEHKQREAARAAAAAEAAAAHEAKRLQEAEAAIKAAEAIKAARVTDVVTAPVLLQEVPKAAAAPSENRRNLLELLERLAEEPILRILHFVQSRYASELGIDADALHQERMKKPGYRTSGPRKLAA